MATIIFIFSQPVEDTEPGISEEILNMFAQTQKNQKQKQQKKENLHWIKILLFAHCHLNRIDRFLTIHEKCGARCGRLFSLP